MKVKAKPMPKVQNIDRRKVQDALAEGLLGCLPQLGVQDTPDHRRRVGRALMHMGMSFMLDGGDAPPVVRKALEEAWKNEMEERHLEGSDD